MISKAGGVDSHQDRKVMGNQAEQMCEAYFRYWNYSYDRCGYEKHVPQAVSFALNDACASYPLLRWLRYMPDFRVNNGSGIVYVDAKARDSVEQQCFEHYLMMNKSTPVYLFIKADGSDDTLYAVRVDQVRFVHDEWQAGRSSSMSGSGTLWKKIDLASSQKQIIVVPAQLA